MGYKLLNAVFATRNHKQILLQQADVLFISHLISPESPDNNTDFYYGELPIRAENERGLTSIIGLIDHTPGAKSKRQRFAIENKKPTRFLFDKTISFANEIKIIGKALAASYKLAKAAKRETDPEKKQILLEAALHAMSPETCNALRIYHIVQSLIREVKPANLVVTWEGRSWERLAIYAARSTDNQVNCIGYQHTILLSSSFSLKQSLGKAYDPDIVFTVGEITKDFLQSLNSFPDTGIVTYGSHRLMKLPVQGFAEHNNDTCLVAPEGIESECVLLFDFAVAIAKKMPGMNFIFRMHPVLPFDHFVKKQARFANLPENCMVSGLPAMTDDFKRSSYILYRGSSVAIYALLGGLKPLYLGLKNELSIDPLFFLDSWRENVQNASDFETIIGTDKKISKDSRHQQWLTAHQLCSKYILPSDESLFFNKLSLNN